MTTATVSARTKSPQVKFTRKHGVDTLVEIIEQVSLYAPETPLTPSQVSELYDASESLANLAQAIGNSNAEVFVECFATRLADLQACVAASKSGKFRLPPREMKRMAGVFAVKLFQGVSEWAEVVTEEGRETLKETMKKLA